MADIQKYFEKFHEVIRVDYDMRQDLAEKRDIVVRRIEKHTIDNARPKPRVFLQGSYRMGTGVKPIADMEYDIDIGLRFDLKPTDKSAEEVRGWVYDAVKEHTNRCEDKAPCVRVAYEAGFHLDLVTYCVWDDGELEKFSLGHKTKGWLPADPPALLEHVRNARASFEGTEDSATRTDQLRRIVRYLRRWSDVRIPNDAEERPSGLAFVLLCCERLKPYLFLDKRADDRRALVTMLSSITGPKTRISVRKPTPEYEDVFGRLEDGQMDKFVADLSALASALGDVETTADPVVACRSMQSLFGDDFPVPDPEDVAKKTNAPAIITSSSSALKP
jgi:hypothetical protein